MDLTINFAIAGNAKAFQAIGWSSPETTGTWSVGPESSIVLPAHLDEPHCLTMRVVGCVLPNLSAPQRLEVIFNDQSVATLLVRSQERFKIQLPVQKQIQPLSEIRFRHPDYRVPHDHGLEDSRPLAIHFKTLRLQPLAEVCQREAELRDRHQILVIGQSHITAVQQAWIQREDHDQSRYRFHFFGLDDYERWVRWQDGFQYNADLVGNIEDQLASNNYDAVISMLGGNEHFVHGALNHPRRFDFVLPGRPDLASASDAELVPYDLICERARFDVEAVLGLMRAACKSNHAVLLHISAPPPAADSEAVVKNLLQAANSKSGRMMQRDVKKYGAAPPEFRLKLWLVYSMVTQEVCRKMEISYISAPRAAMDEKGYILGDLTSDSFHGTEAYGQMVLAEVERHLDQMVK